MMGEAFADAVEFLKQKKAVTKAEYRAMTDAARAKAFMVSGYTSAEVLSGFLEELTAALEQGETFEHFRENINSFLERNGYEGMNPWKAETIFRTNLQTAYNAGHYKRMTSPNLMEKRPYWQYQTAGDAQVRETHAAMDGKVYRADDPIWDVWYPPNGFKCRCTVISLSPRQVEARGLQVSDGSPIQVQGRDTKLMWPDKGFATNPAKHVWKPDTKSLHPDVEKAYRSRLT